jgi:hypothetical protein
LSVREGSGFKVALKTWLARGVALDRRDLQEVELGVVLQKLACVGIQD